MAKQNGTLVLLKIQVDGEPSPVTVGAAISDSFEVSIDLPGATTKNSAGWSEHIQGVRSASGTITGLHDPEETFTEDEVFDMIQNRKSATIQYGTFESGSKYFEFTASISNFSKNSEMEQPVGFDFDYTVNGEPTQLTVTS